METSTNYLPTSLAQLQEANLAVAVLRDGQQRAHHDRAAQTVIEVLAASARILQDIKSCMPRPNTDERIRSEIWIESLEAGIASALQARGLVWPAPVGQSAPSTTRDLIQLYQTASNAVIIPGDHSRAMLSIVITAIETSTRTLMSAWDGKRLIEVAGKLASVAPNSEQTRLSNFLIAVACAVSLLELLQGGTRTLDQGIGLPDALSEVTALILKAGADVVHAVT